MAVAARSRQPYRFEDARTKRSAFLVGAGVVVVLGDTSQVPNQGATIASETIQITAVPLRRAAAQARHFLIARAAERLALPVEDLSIEDGLIRGRDNRSVSYGELIADETIRLELAEDVPVKAVDAYSIVGQSVPRVDIPAKATGEPVYVHDVRLPGMLHGRVVRPPYAGVDAGPFVGTSLIAVDEASVRHIPGLVAVVRIGDFIGVVAEREENAIKAAAQLRVSWKKMPTLPDLEHIETSVVEQAGIVPLAANKQGVISLPGIPDPTKLLSGAGWSDHAGLVVSSSRKERINRCRPALSAFPFIAMAIKL